MLTAHRIILSVVVCELPLSGCLARLSLCRQGTQQMSCDIVCTMAQKVPHYVYVCLSEERRLNEA